MTISKVIADLQKIRQEHGDLKVIIEDGEIEQVYYIERSWAGKAAFLSDIQPINKRGEK